MPLPFDPRLLDPASQAMRYRSYYLNMLGDTPEQDEPMPQEEPQSRFASGLDAASLAVLQQLRSLPPARGFGAGLAQGLAGGLAQSRAQQVMERKAKLEDAQKAARGRNASAERFRQSARRAVAEARMKEDLAAEKPQAAGRQMYTLPDGTQIPMTAALANGLAGAQGVIPQRAEVGIRPKIDPETAAGIERVADAIARGDASPDVNDYGRDSNVRIALTDALIKRGVNVRSEGQKFNAEKTFLRSANGTVALRGMRNVVNARESLDYTENLLDESVPLIPRGRFTMLNKGQMTAAAEGVYGPEAAAAARKLRAQVAAVRFELSNIYMGGTAPTDQAVKKAMDVIDSNWSEAGLRGAISLARRDLGIRVNAIKEVGPISLGKNGEVLGAPSPGGQFPNDKAEKDTNAIDAWLKRGGKK